MYYISNLKGVVPIFGVGWSSEHSWELRFRNCPNMWQIEFPDHPIEGPPAIFCLPQGTEKATFSFLEHQCLFNWAHFTQSRGSSNNMGMNDVLTWIYEKIKEETGKLLLKLHLLK